MRLKRKPGSCSLIDQCLSAGCRTTCRPAWIYSHQTGPRALQRGVDGTFSSQDCSVSWARHHSACISYRWLTSLTPGPQRLEKLRMLDSQLGVVILLCISPGTIPEEPGASESLSAECHGGTGLPFSLHVASHPLGDGDQHTAGWQRVRRQGENHEARGRACELQSPPSCHILPIPTGSHGRSVHREAPSRAAAAGGPSSSSHPQAEKASRLPGPCHRQC